MRVGDECSKSQVTELSGTASFALGRKPIHPVLAADECYRRSLDSAVELSVVGPECARRCEASENTGRISRGPALGRSLVEVEKRLDVVAHWLCHASCSLGARDRLLALLGKARIC